MQKKSFSRFLTDNIGFLFIYCAVADRIPGI